MIVLCGAAFLHYRLRRRWLFPSGLAIMPARRAGLLRLPVKRRLDAQFKTSTPLAIGAEAFPIDRIRIAADRPYKSVNFRP
jgi:hypothetical protein